jgi:hypothetical protein
MKIVDDIEKGLAEYRAKKYRQLGDHIGHSQIVLLCRATRAFGTAFREFAKQEYEAEDHRLGGTGRTFAQFIQQEWDIDIDLAEMIAEKEHKPNEPA